MALKRIPIDSDWAFRQANKPDSSFLPTAQFPAAIHLDLMHHGIIPDPFLDTNATKIQWIGEEEWLYRTKFRAPTRDSNTTKFKLIFEGLDTHTTISLNSKEILKTENMYIEYGIDVTDQIKPEEENELQVLFHSTFIIGKKLEKEAKEKPLFFHNGDSSRLQVRKAPYSYGWDFTPTFLTCGPWRPIYLDCYTARLTEFATVPIVAEDLSSANIKIEAEVEGSGMDKLQVQISVSFTTEEPHVAKTNFDISNPELWWPAGNGSQPLYQVNATVLSADGTSLCTNSKRIGLRRVQLIQRPLQKEPGKTFFFEINNTPIYSRGANWTPADVFLPRITPKVYRKWVELVVHGNQNMIRIWGGGVYEDQAFYDACDELGIMIWHDFMLACGSYPATPKFLKTIEEEAVYNVRRLRSHPSIVLWCGNNEDHMFADKYNAQYDYDDHNPENWLKTNWPARYIYDKLLPDICEAEIPEIPYHNGSPWGGSSASDPTVGDVHAWDVWMKASLQYPYQWYYKISGRFVSEFGLKSYPSVKCISEYVTDPHERYPQSRILDYHLKASSKSTWAKDYRTVALYIQENFRIGKSLEKWVYGSQLSQAEAMHFAFSGWRRLWKGPGHEENAGSLVWVLNDVWPSVSWSLADYKVRPKPSFFSIKRSLAPIIVCANRVEVEVSRPNEYTESYIVREERLQVWGSNFTTKIEEYELLLQKIRVSTGEILWEKSTVVSLPENRSTELFDEKIDEVESQTVLVSAKLLRDGNVVSRFLDWPQPLKYLDLPRADGIAVRVENDEVHVSSPVPIKGLVLETDDDEVEFSDNCIDLSPKEEQIIHAKGLRGRPVSFMHLAIAAE
ncbi:glycoside hydrolase family 2 protein [Xylogone sp. PMI_703]|nr:glycoside hydrolase family 2 protein [Xylogone sp. PMI_703]